MKKDFKIKFKEGFYKKILKMAKKAGYESIEEFREKEQPDLDSLRREYYEKVKDKR